MAAVCINDIVPAPSGRKGRDMAISSQFSSLSDWELKWTLFITYETIFLFMCRKFFNCQDFSNVVARKSQSDSLLETILK